MLAQRALAGARGCALAGRAVELVRRTLPQVSSCELLEPSADGRTLRVRASDVETRRGRRQPVDPRSFLGCALQSPWPSLTPDLQRDDRFAPPEVVDPDARAAVAVSIPGEGSPAGVLCAMSRASHAFAEEDGQFLQAIALVLATARAREAEAHAHAPVDVLASLTEAAAHGLRVARASVWFFTPGRTKIVCADQFSRDANAHEHGAELLAQAFPAYFRAIEAERTLAADDAHTDPRTAEFSAPYLAPLGIGAMLDIPIWVDDAMVGVLCHEHVGGPRTWTAEEEELAYTMGSLVARAEERRRKAKHKAA
jgi:GAF domain-containing protein